MSVDQQISLNIIKAEVAACEKNCTRYDWEISEPDPAHQLLVVIMKSPIDRERYVIEIQFDNYKEYPLLIEFIHPQTGQSAKAYPAPSKIDGGFFHGNGCICHPCSRKAYQNLHRDWNLAGWQSNPGVGSLTNLNAILLAIYSRISDSTSYNGRSNA